jgi:hypothetical protein
MSLEFNSKYNKPNLRNPDPGNEGSSGSHEVNLLEQIPILSQKVKQNLAGYFNGEYKSSKASPIRLVTSKPVYYSSILQEYEQQIVCVVKDDKLGNLAIIETKKR